LNSMNTDMKFSIGYDHKWVHFMWIEVVHGELITTLYQKETDRNTFLLDSSVHPSAPSPFLQANDIVASWEKLY
jgi:hypothetical protein